MMFWLAYALTCALLHHVLAFHYQDACRPTWWSFGLDSLFHGSPSAYCALVSKALHALRAGPLLAAVPALAKLPRLPSPPNLPLLAS